MSYIIRLYYQGTKEVVVSINSPVTVYNTLYLNFAFWTFMGLCWWCVLDEYALFVKYWVASV